MTDDIVVFTPALICSARERLRPYFQFPPNHHHLVSALSKNYFLSIIQQLLIAAGQEAACSGLFSSWVFITVRDQFPNVFIIGNIYKYKYIFNLLYLNPASSVRNAVQSGMNRFRNVRKNPSYVGKIVGDLYQVFLTTTAGLFTSPIKGPLDRTCVIMNSALKWEKPLEMDKNCIL